MLGFNSQEYTHGYHNSENIVSTMNVNSIFVTVDIIQESYVNGKPKPVFHAYFPNVSSGYTVIERP